MKKSVWGVSVMAILCSVAVSEVSAGGFWEACKRAGNEIANWNEVAIVERENIPYDLKDGSDPAGVIRQAANECATALRGTATVTNSETGKEICELHIRKHTATVMIVYDKKSFSIRYVSSVALKYDEVKKTIHPAYNDWTKMLAEKIASCALAGREAKDESQNVKSEIATVESTKSDGEGVQDVKTRLEQLKSLKDNDLITEEEYNKKRAEILKSI